MLKKFNFLLALGSAAALFYGCQKEFTIDGLPILPTPDAAWTSQAVSPAQHPARILLNAQQPASQSFSINMAAGGVANGAGGIKLRIPSDAFVKLDGSAVTGAVDVSIKEAITFADMISYGLGTITDNSLLATGGMVQISARQGSDVLKLKTGKRIGITFPATFSPSFKAFAGSETGIVENPVKWTENPLWITTPDTLQGNLVTNIQIDSIGWINCDRFYNEPNPTNIYLKLPDGYGNSNTSCFIIFKAEKVMAGLPGDAANKRFWQGSSYKVPGGKLVTLVAVSKKDNKNYFASTTVTITPDMTVTLTSMEEVNDATLKTRLNSL
jgi:hypothetical protein